MEDAKISVIVPVYKVEKYLDRCVESIVNQTYKNLEIILVDDGSPDDCPVMCDAWAKKDERIQVIHKENGGLSSARNAALDISTGEYVCFVDSDDWIDSDMIEVLVRCVSEKKADVAMCGFYMDYSGERESDHVSLGSRVIEGEGIFKAFILDEIRPEMCGKLYAMNLFLDMRFDTKTKYAEDLQMNYHIMKKVKSFVSLDTCKYHYIQSNDGSITAPYMTDGRAQGYKITKFFVENETDPELRKLCVWRHVRGTFAILSRVVNGEDRVFYDRYYKELLSEILTYKKDILIYSRFSIKYKIAVVLIMVSPQLYLKVNRSILNRG